MKTQKRKYFRVVIGVRGLSTSMDATYDVCANTIARAEQRATRIARSDEEQFSAESAKKLFTKSVEYVNTVFI